MKARLDRETVAEVTLTIFVEDINAELPPQQNATGILAALFFLISGKS